jgi:hypothetical protein
MVHQQGLCWQGKENSRETEFSTISVTAGYGRTVGWQVIAGRDFSPSPAADSTGFVINETAAKLMGLQDPVDKPFNGSRCWIPVSGSLV